MSQRRIATVTKAATRARNLRPEDAATPSAAAIQTDAAVTNWRWERRAPASWLMAPAPRKPMPVLTAAPIRALSPDRESRAVSVKTDAPKATRARVRTPAGAEAARRSMPIIAPQAIETPILISISASAARPSL